MTTLPSGYMPIAQAAKLADTDVTYLHKLIKAKANALPGYSEKRGKLNYWYVDVGSARFVQLMSRLSNGAESVIAPSDSYHPIDWDEWESMCKRGEELTRRGVTIRTLKGYRGYIEGFFKAHSRLSRETLRAALSVYEKRETRERDFYDTKYHLYYSMMTIARYFVFKRYEANEFLDSLLPLRPVRKHRAGSRPCHSAEAVLSAVPKIESASNKRGLPAFSKYNQVLNRTIMLLAFYTGARAAEMCGIRLRDISYLKGSIRLFGKGGKERYVGVCKDLRQALKEYWQVRPKCEGTDQLLVDYKGRPQRPDYLGRRLARLRKYTDLDKLMPHSLRHTSITWMLNGKKIPLPIVRDAVGHTNMATTNRYAQPSANDVIDAMRGM